MKDQVASPPILVGCGILRREIEEVTRRKGWKLEARWLDPALHCDLAALERALESGLEAARGREVLVFYGACHPRMDAILREHGAPRTPGVNCIEMLLGSGRYLAELEGGAFFLPEGWVRDFDRMLLATFGPNLDIARGIFQDGRSYLLALRTPCSGDFAAGAEAAAREVGLPLRWSDASLDNLEAMIGEAWSRVGRALKT